MEKEVLTREKEFIMVKRKFVNNFRIINKIMNENEATQKACIFVTFIFP